MAKVLKFNQDIFFKIYNGLFENSYQLVSETTEGEWQNVLVFYIYMVAAAKRVMPGGRY